MFDLVLHNFHYILYKPGSLVTLLFLLELRATSYSKLHDDTISLLSTPAELAVLTKEQAETEATDDP